MSYQPFPSNLNMDACKLLGNQSGMLITMGPEWNFVQNGTRNNSLKEDNISDAMQEDQLNIFARPN